MSRCLDQQFESMIHAYELGLLMGDELTQFEQHLMDCNPCYKQVESQLETTRLLRHDPYLRPSAGEAKEIGLDSQKTDSNSIKRFLLLAAVLVVITIPVFKYVLTPDSTTNISQQLELYPMRSSGDRTITLEDGGEVKIKFVVESIGSNESVTIKIVSASNAIIYQTDNYGKFNEMGLGVLTITSDLFKIGHYKLQIFDPTTDSVRASYNFRVE